jgi:hypothetical protein
MYDAHVLDTGGVTDSNGTIVSLFDRGQIAPHIYIPGSGTSDAGLRDSRHQYVGASVYVRGGLVFRCDALASLNTQYSLGENESVRVTSIQRSTGEGAVWTLGGNMGERDQDAGASFVVVEPLIVHFAGSNVTNPAGPRGHPTACSRPSALFSDMWEAQRFFTALNPALLPGLTAAFRDALAQRNVLRGMARDMIADTFGYPSVYGTVIQMNSLSKWFYAAPAPSQFNVFFKGDRVIKYDPPGAMP